MKIRNLNLFVLILLTTIFGSGICNVNNVQASTGEIQFGFNSYIPGNSYLIVLKELTGAIHYGLTFTAGVATTYNFTASSAEERVEYRATLEAPTSGSVVTFTLLYYPAPYYNTSTTIDTLRTQATEIENVINRDTLVEIIMLVMVIMLVLGIVLVIFRKMT